MNSEIGKGCRIRKFEAFLNLRSHSPIINVHYCAERNITLLRFGSTINSKSIEKIYSCAPPTISSPCPSSKRLFSFSDFSYVTGFSFTDGGCRRPAECGLHVHRSWRQGEGPDARPRHRARVVPGLHRSLAKFPTLQRRYLRM